MVSQISQNTASTSKVTDKTSTESKESEFESLMQNQNQSESSDSQVNSKDDSDVSTPAEEGGEQVVTPEVTDAQRELMAALSMQMVTYRTVDVVVEAPVEGQIEMVEPTVETNLLDNQTLNLGDSAEADVSGELGNQMGQENMETVEEGDFLFEEGDFELEEVPELEVEAPVEEVEIPEEIMETTEVKTAEETVDAPEEVKVEETDNVDTDTETDDVDVNEQGEVSNTLFQKVEAAPVKVAETVNTQDPEMDTQMANVILDAYEAGDNTVVIQLTPEGLGTVTAQITQTVDGLLQVVLQTTDDAVANLLKGHVNQLAQALQGSAQTVTVEVHNTNEAENAEQGTQDQSENNQGGNQNQGQKKKDEPEFEYNDDFLQQMRLGLNNFSFDDVDL